MKTQLIVTILSLPALGFAEGKTLAPETKSWLTAVQKPSRAVLSEIQRFPNLSAEYIEKLPRYLSSRVKWGLEANFGEVLSSGECSPEVKVQFLNHVSPMSSSDKHVREFESQFVHIQVLACLEGVTAKQVAKAYKSAEFKLKGADTVTNSQVKGDRICQVTRVAVLGESEYCYTENVLASEEATYFHSYNDWNRDGVEVPVYYREMIAAVTDAKINGQTGAAFYTDIYVRGKKLPSLFKGFANSSIAKSQASSLEVLHAISKKQSAQ